MKITPYEAWTNRVPDLSNLQIFGSQAYAKNLHYLKKLDERAQEYIFVGYAPNAYRLWCEESEKIIVSRDVVFTNKHKHKQNSDGTKSVKIPIFVSNDDESGTMAEDEGGEVPEIPAEVKKMRMKKMRVKKMKRKAKQSRAQGAK